MSLHLNLCVVVCCFLSACSTGRATFMWKHTFDGSAYNCQGTGAFDNDYRYWIAGAHELTCGVVVSIRFHSTAILLILLRDADLSYDVDATLRVGDESVCGWLIWADTLIDPSSAPRLACDDGERARMKAVFPVFGTVTVDVDDGRLLSMEVDVETIERVPSRKATEQSEFIDDSSRPAERATVRGLLKGYWQRKSHKTWL